MRVLALNSGSSSLKAAVRDRADGDPAVATTVERVTDFAAALDEVAEQVAEHGGVPDAVAHRVVHGGPRHRRPTVVDDQLLADLRELVPLAPLHLPQSIDTIVTAQRRWPDATHVACFDTGFHETLPDAAQRLAVPRELADLGIRRYGFHGLSVQSILLARPSLGNVVVAHLGSGCSVTAVAADGRSRYTTMSFTPTAGMMSATRSGDLDPEIALYLIEQHGWSTAQIREAFNKSSGLAGVSGGRHDVRDLLAADDAAAALALEMFVADTARAIAACSTALERWDALVFTGGVGQHSTELRERVLARLRLDGVHVEVVAADEERVMDRQARRLLTGGGSAG